MENDDDPELAQLKAELAKLRAANDRLVSDTVSAIDRLEQSINEAERSPEPPETPDANKP